MAALLLAAGTLAGATAPAAQATFPGRNGAVAAWWQHAGKYGDPGTGVSLIRPRASQRAYGFCHSWLYDTAGPDDLCRHPDGVAFSPDGKTFAVQTRDLIWHGEYSPTTDGATTLDLLRTGETTPIRHPVLPFDGSPAWSPDGSLMLVTRDGSLHLVRPDGTELGALVPGADPDWSVRGTIAFTRAGNVYVMRMGSSPRQVTFRGGESPSWAPDGKQIAFIRDTELWTLHLRRGTARRLTSNAAAESPVWSPDGKRIAFVQSGVNLRWKWSDGRGRPHRLDGEGGVDFIGDYGYIGSLSWQARPRGR